MVLMAAQRIRASEVGRLPPAAGDAGYQAQMVRLRTLLRNRIRAVLTDHGHGVPSPIERLLLEERAPRGSQLLPLTGWGAVDPARAGTLG
jgi:hypothetical protein